MSQRKIVIEPDPILRKKSESLEKVDDVVGKVVLLSWDSFGLFLVA